MTLQMPGAMPSGYLPPQGSRIAWIDVARGMGIILVVYGHVLQGLLAAGVLAKTSALWHSDYPIYTFHMPLFFVLAGLTVKSSLARGTEQFLLTKVWTIAYPYFLWSYIQGSIQLHIGLMIPGAVNHARSPAFVESLLWQPIAQFWFLYVLFICHMLAPLALLRRWIGWMIGIGSLTLCALGHATPTSYMLPFYLCGMLMGDRIKQWQPKAQFVFIAAILCAALFAAAVHFGRAASAGDAESIWSLPATVSGVGMVVLFSQVSAGAITIPTKLLAAMGRMSMTIFVLHGLADSSARIMLTRLGVMNPSEQLMLGLVVGLSLPIICHLVLRKMNLLTPLGLAQWKRKSVRLASSGEETDLRSSAFRLDLLLQAVLRRCTGLAQGKG